MDIEHRIYFPHLFLLIGNVAQLYRCLLIVLTYVVVLSFAARINLQ